MAVPARQYDRGFTACTVEVYFVMDVWTRTHTGAANLRDMVATLDDVADRYDKL